jgi:hypothetical protein
MMYTLIVLTCITHCANPIEIGRYKTLAKCETNGAKYIESVKDELLAHNIKVIYTCKKEAK